MKRLINTLLIALAFLSPFAFATQPDILANSPNIPSLYTDNLVRAQAPNLFIDERAAFSLYESLQQITEAFVQTRGCVSFSGDVTAYTDNTGSGDLTITTNGGSLFLKVNNSATDAFRGDKYIVSGSTGDLDGTHITGIAAEYAFNKTGSIMQGRSLANVPNPTAPDAPDPFTGQVIKDFYVVPTIVDSIKRNVVFDWGLQVINKKSYPQAKYWQRSRFIREDGVESQTLFRKVRIAGGSACAISISTHGSGNPEFFYQSGTLAVYPVTSVVRAMQQ
jgi:hypothetical protein